MPATTRSRGTRARPPPPHSEPTRPTHLGLDFGLQNGDDQNLWSQPPVHGALSQQPQATDATGTRMRPYLVSKPTDHGRSSQLVKINVKARCRKPSRQGQGLWLERPSAGGDLGG